MSLPYIDEYLTSPDGVVCQVIDVTKLDFSKGVEARKIAETLVRRAEGGEKLETKNEGKIEAVYVAKPGDAIFINLHDLEDAYVPGNPDGTRWQFGELAAKGYEITGDDPENGGIRVRISKTSRLLHEVVQAPSCLKNAWGEGQHVFLFKGATLKTDDKGHVSGIAKAAFDATWEITPPPSIPVPAATPPAQKA